MAGDGFSGALTRTAGENVGTYAILQGSLTAGANYALTYVSANLTITPKPITVTADAKSKVYGSADPALTYQVTSGALVGTDSFSGTLSRSTGENVGTYPILQGTLTAGTNYTLTYVGANLTITPAPLTINPGNASRVYGDPNPSFTFTYASLVNGDSTIATPPTCSTSTALNTGVGSYPTITCSGAASPNYSPISYGPNGTLMITPRPITVTADAKSKVYGDADPALTYQLTSGSLSPGDSFSGSLTRAAGTNVGTYAILQGSLTAGANYALTYVSANLTITARLTVTSLTSSLSVAATPVRVDLSATVSPGGAGPIPVGSVNFTDSMAGDLGSVPLSGTGVATLSITSPGIGRHVVTATYVPTGLNFVGSSSPSNTAPEATITGPSTGSLNPVGTPFNFTATFSDVIGTTPTTAAWSFDSSLSLDGTVAESSGSGTVTRSYAFSNAGVYSVQLTVNDNVGGITIVNSVGSDKAFVVVYDPNAGFVTGGGWINSPAGAYTGTSLTGKANFGFVSKYKKGQSTPDGETEFQFQAGNFNFHSTLYDWLVIAGAKAQFKGSGTVNGTGDFAFMLTSIDGQVNGGGGIDKFRIKIWNKATSETLYDNQMGAADGDTPSTALGGGSIVIHDK